MFWECSGDVLGMSGRCLEGVGQLLGMFGGCLGRCFGVFGSCLVCVLSHFGSFRDCFGGREVGDHQKPVEPGPLVADPTVLLSDSTSLLPKTGRWHEPEG